MLSDQASIRPHGHRSPDVERIVPGNSRKSRPNTGMPGWWHSWFWKTNMCLSVIDISIVRSPPLEDSSSFIVSISIPYGAPSITIVVLSHLVPIACRWLVLRYMSTPQTAQYRQKFNGGFEECFRIRRNFCGPSRTPALMWITFTYLHHSIWSPLHHRHCSVPSW